MIKRILLFMEVEFTSSSASARKFMPWRKLFFLMIQEFFNIFFIWHLVWPQSDYPSRVSSKYGSKRSEEGEKKQEGLRIFFGPTLKPKFWLARVLVCLDCECVLAKHQFFIIISRFSRISRNIGFFLGSRDFLQPSKTFYVWTLNPIKSVWGHR